LQEPRRRTGKYTAELNKGINMHDEQNGGQSELRLTFSDFRLLGEALRQMEHVEFDERLFTNPAQNGRSNIVIPISVVDGNIHLCLGGLKPAT
jgi:hypothetical protein